MNATAPSSGQTPQSQGPQHQSPQSQTPSAARLNRGDGVSSLSPALLAVLRCPMTRAKLVIVDEHHMMSERPFNEGVHPVFEVVDGIPNFLPLTP
ncbi:hypothetical protein FCK90_05325 [Kocuria coralli]|uniref:Trm112 family protein n=1 Tax=Kocuria coralli TaxID=1461025 RepID=A0A5J5L0Y2_9MICC|nr:hypothetical protein [Kocuria coralli]KAA9394601.1 hypothetical protein FCK90_05325 [Kocuria coralli]